MTLYEIINNFFTREEVENWFSNYNLQDTLNNTQIEEIQKTGIWTKEKLAKKIVDHYLFEQIGFETMGLFKHHVKVKMQEIMEHYLPIIYTNSIQYDPLINVDYTETFQRNINSNGSNRGQSSSSSDSNSSGLNISSDTPQGQINKTEILEGTYASGTSASETTTNVSDQTNTEGSANNTTDETYSKNIKGNSGVSATYQKMIEQFRDNIIAIDKEIIDSLNDLFMLIY